MIKSVHVFALAISAMAVVACHEKNDSSNIITTRKPAKEIRKETQSVGDYSQSRVIDWKGSAFTVAVERKADKSLPLVDDGTGNKYYDNRITVSITGSDGNDVFSKVFTKADFAGHVEKEYLETGALLGVVFDRVEGDCAYFAASIGSPDNMSDDFVPLVVRLNYGSRQMKIYRDTTLDTDNGEKKESEPVDDDEDGV